MGECGEFENKLKAKNDALKTKLEEKCDSLNF